MKNRKRKQGVGAITRAIGSPLKNYPRAVSPDTVRRALLNGTLPSEPRTTASEAYQTHVNSLHLADPNVDKFGIKDIADHLGMPVWRVKDGVAAGLIPTDKVFGRYYSCSNSLDAYKKKGGV